jgi:hypothetical protein
MQNVLVLEELFDHRFPRLTSKALRVIKKVEEEDHVWRN